LAAQPLSIPLPDGDELLNAPAAAAFLGIAHGTLMAHLGQRATAARPFPDAVEDPVALIVSDAGEAERVRTLLKMSGNKRPDGVPQVFRRSELEHWDSQRLRQRTT
jgi:hypothetical protein